MRSAGSNCAELTGSPTYINPVSEGTHPIPPHCSISYGADIDLQQTGGPFGL